MLKQTKEYNKIIEEKLEYIGLDLNKISKTLLNVEKIKYKPIKTYEDNDYKVYKYVDVRDIEILITPADRLDDLNDKLKKSLPIAFYLDKDDEEKKELYNIFLEMLDNLDIDKLKEIDEEQKCLNKNIPYEIKYKNNYIWQVYYSDTDNKYFMLNSSNEKNNEALFYLINKKIKNKSEKIYIPISHLEYDNSLLRKDEIKDLENYLWFFTKEWPNIYEVRDLKRKTRIEIIGKIKVYEDVKSTYKITLNDKKEAQEFFKLIKALFILGSNDEIEYDFKTILNEKGTIDFCYNFKEINYKTLTEFIKNEVNEKQKKIDEFKKLNIIEIDKLEKLKEEVERQKEEYLLKEKQITSFLECKKTFFGKVRFFFKKSKKIKKNDLDVELHKDSNDFLNEDNKENNNTDETNNDSKNDDSKLDNKDLYTIEDLLKICGVLKDEETNYKNTQMDIKALNNKSESLERKIKNATLYINEIESHKKSIFDFWKYTNKDESNLLMQSEENDIDNKNKLKKQFCFEEDIEEFGKMIDIKQKEVLTQDECDAIYAIRNDLYVFNTVNKNKVLKKDEVIIEKKLKQLKEEYLENIDIIENKDFDIFGNVAEDKTKIKTLKNNKHRETEKDKYRILNISSNTLLDDYLKNIYNYNTLLNEAYGKIQTPYDISLYMASEAQISEDTMQIADLNVKSEIDSIKDKDTVILYKFNVKENMPMFFYSNIMFYDNYNKTLPDGMDVETKALIDFNRFDLKLISRKDFYMNTSKDEYSNMMQLFQVYEYDVETKKEKTNKK